MTIVIFMGSLLGAMALGVPIAFALLACGVALMLHLDSFDTQILAQNLLEGVNNYPLLAVPFFMLAGELMNAGGLSRRIVAVAEALVGHVRGGLGYVAILACVVVASISGSSSICRKFRRSIASCCMTRTTEVGKKLRTSPNHRATDGEDAPRPAVRFPCGLRSAS